MPDKDTSLTTVDAVARAIYESAVEGTMREPESWEELEETALEPWRRNARAALATIEWLETARSKRTDDLRAARLERRAAASEFLHAVNNKASAEERCFFG